MQQIEWEDFQRVELRVGEGDAAGEQAGGDGADAEGLAGGAWGHGGRSPEIASGDPCSLLPGAQPGPS